MKLTLAIVAIGTVAVLYFLNQPSVKIVLTEIPAEETVYFAEKIKEEKVEEDNVGGPKWTHEEIIAAAENIHTICGHYPEVDSVAGNHVLKTTCGNFNTNKLPDNMEVVPYSARCGLGFYLKIDTPTSTVQKAFGCMQDFYDGVWPKSATST